MVKGTFSGKSGRSGLPQDVIFKDYPKNESTSGEIDDTMTDIDKVKNKSVGKAKKYISNQK
jgi:hypothetical protein